MLAEKLAADETVLIDTICNVEEADFYRATFSDKLAIVALEAPFETSAGRLALRSDRSID